MLKQQNKDGYESSRFLYIIEAALEYFVAISVGTVYLAKITGYCGISDEITAILTAFVSLGCGFQFFSVFIGRNMPVKPVSFRRQPDSPVRAGNQFAAQFIFQVIHHSGDVGLVTHKHIGRPGQIPVFRYIIKHFVILKIYCHTPFSSPLIL